MYHKDGQLCCILGNLNFLGGGWGFGMGEIKNCPKDYFFVVVGVVVVVEVICT